MKVIVALLGLCFMKNILAENYVFEFAVGGDDDNDNDIERLDGEYHDIWTTDSMYKDREGITPGFNSKNHDPHDSFNVKNGKGDETLDKPIKGKVINIPLTTKVSSNPESIKEKTIQEKEVHPEKGSDNKAGVIDPETLLTPEYRGEHFQEKYLSPDNTQVTIEDFNVYLNRLNRSVNYFSTVLNKTDVNVGFGAFMTGAIMKQTLKTYGTKINGKLSQNLKYIIRKADNILSHYAYRHLRKDGSDDLEYNIVGILRDDTTLQYSLDVNNFNKGRLTKWILRDGHEMHDFLREMDDATLPKEKYVALQSKMSEYYVTIEESDECISRIYDLQYPIPVTRPLQRCVPDPYCENLLHSDPSIAYALSHRQLNLMFRRFLRRCYVRTEDYDLKHIDKLCSFMYRETVYIARRGFFARDMFLEHIALCGLLGYEEYHRPAWFRKAASWVDDHGCIEEFKNLEINRTRIALQSSSEDKRSYAQKRLSEILKTSCHHHPMALGMIVLSMGLRYVMHRLP